MLGRLQAGGTVSGDVVTFLGDGMAAVVEAVTEVDRLLGQSPVIVGGLAVMCRLSRPYRATIALDVVDRLAGLRPQLQVLRAAEGARAVEPAAVLLPTRFGQVKVDVLEVRQIEIDQPSDDPGDRLHVFSHAWASDSATRVTIEVVRSGGELVAVSALVAESGPLVAMKLQAIDNRAVAKQGTDLQDILRLVLDPASRAGILDQIAACDPLISADIARHVDRWLVRRRQDALRWMHSTGGFDLTLEDVDLTADLLVGAAET